MTANSILSSRPKLRALIADDSDSTRYLLAAWLRKDGYEVVEVGSGAEALNVSARLSFDIIILDINLPDMTGYAVCEELKGRPNDGIPVLQISATKTGVADRSEGLRRGADSYLIKPIEQEELLATVAALIRGAAAERTALRLARRLRQLNDATMAINESVSLAHLTETLAKEACTLFGCNSIVAFSIDDISFYAQCLPNESPQISIGHDTISLETIIASIDKNRYRMLPLEGKLGHSGMLLVEVFNIFDKEQHTEVDLVLSQFSRAANTALTNMRMHSIERHIALTLQRSLLPALQVPMNNVDFAVRYRASAEHAEVGGDFYEVFELDERRIALAIGDVVGHSLEAAAIMVQLRTGIRSYMLEGHSPVTAITLLNDLLQRFHPHATATACIAVYDRRTGVCELVNAGHPPPLVVSKGAPAFLPIGGTLLGWSPLNIELHHFLLAPGDCVLMYTDGLIEQREESLVDGFERLAVAARHLDGDIESICDELLRRVGPATIGDDIALVAFRRR